MVDELRVSDWDSFIGQEKLKARLDVHITAAVVERRPLESVLLVGPPGFGKTSLATIIAGRLGVDLREFTMPVDDRVLIRTIKSEMGVMLLDELHRAPKRQQEQLLPLIEFGYVQDKRGIRHEANALSIIGATTEPELVITPLYDRFDIKPEFEEYTAEEMGRIVAGMALKAGLMMDPEMATALGRATGGIPRRARQLVLAARDLIQTGETPGAHDVLSLCQVDSDGLSVQHQKYLKVVEQQGGICGLRTLQTILRLSEPIVRDLERLLVKQELLTYSERGRELTAKGYQKLAPTG